MTLDPRSSGAEQAAARRRFPWLSIALAALLGAIVGGGVLSGLLTSSAATAGESTVQTATVTATVTATASPEPAPTVTHFVTVTPTPEPYASPWTRDTALQACVDERLDPDLAPHARVENENHVNEGTVEEYWVFSVNAKLKSETGSRYSSVTCRVWGTPDDPIVTSATTADFRL